MRLNLEDLVNYYKSVSDFRSIRTGCMLSAVVAPPLNQFFRNFGARVGRSGLDKLTMLKRGANILM
jgi:hypothetical protein